MAGNSGHAVAAIIIEGDKMNIIEKQIEENELVISVIGAGGIGSLLMPALARALCAGELVKEVGPVLLQVFDGDIVEENNLQHQNFNRGLMNMSFYSCLICPNQESAPLFVVNALESVSSTVFEHSLLSS